MWHDFVDEAFDWLGTVGPAGNYELEGDMIGSGLAVGAESITVVLFRLGGGTGGRLRMGASAVAASWAGRGIPNASVANATRTKMYLLLEDFS